RRGTVRKPRGAEVHAEMLVATDVLKVLREHAREGRTIRDGVVLASLQPGTHRVAHFLGCLRKDIGLNQLRDRAVDDPRSLGTIDLEVSDRSPGRNCEEREMLDRAGFTRRHVERAERSRIPFLFLDEKLDVEWLAFLDA